MKPNQKLSDSEGRQVCLFPLPICNITQTSSPSSFSHCCGNPIDCVGQTFKAPYYAPCDMRLIAVGTKANGNERTWQSIDIVNTPSGNGYVCISFTHDDLPPYNTIGDTVRQGNLVGHTGTTGFVTGDHLHLDQAHGQNKRLVSYGITCSGGNLCYALQDSADPTGIYYINDTLIVDTKGLNFKTFEGGTTPSEYGKKLSIYYMLRPQRKR